MRRRGRTVRRYSLEHDEQTAVIRWRDAAGRSIEGLQLLHAVPNGGWRDPMTGAKMRAEGVSRGVPDLCLPVARGGHHGLYVEMKTESLRPKRPGSKGGVSDAQREWIERLRAEGFRAVVCYGAREAIATIDGYLKEKKTEVI